MPVVKKGSARSHKIDIPLTSLVEESCTLPVWDDTDIANESWGDVSKHSSATTEQNTNLFVDNDFSQMANLEVCFGSHLAGWNRPSNIFSPFKAIVYRPQWPQFGNPYLYEPSSCSGGDSVNCNGEEGSCGEEGDACSVGGVSNSSLQHSNTDNGGTFIHSSTTTEEDVHLPSSTKEAIAIYRRMRPFVPVPAEKNLTSVNTNTSPCRRRHRHREDKVDAPYFMRAFNSALMALSQNQHCVRPGCYAWELIYPQPTAAQTQQEPSSTWNPLYNGYGKYCVKLFIQGAYRKIVVDDRLPVDKNGYSLLSVTDQKEIWPALLFKALAKSLGPSNPAVRLERTLIDDPVWILCTLLGGYVPERICPIKEEMKAAEFIRTCLNANQYCICAEVHPELGPKHGLESQLYTILDAKLYQKSCLLRVCGFNAIWKGNYAFDSPSWTTEVEKALEFDPQTSRDNYALGKRWYDFWIIWEDFVPVFSGKLHLLHPVAIDSGVPLSCPSFTSMRQSQTKSLPPSTPMTQLHGRYCHFKLLQHPPETPAHIKPSGAQRSETPQKQIDYNTFMPGCFTNSPADAAVRRTYVKWLLFEPIPASDDAGSDEEDISTVVHNVNTEDEKSKRNSFHLDNSSDCITDINESNTSGSVISKNKLQPELCFPTTVPPDPKTFLVTLLGHARQGVGSANITSNSTVNQTSEIISSTGVEFKLDIDRYSWEDSCPFTSVLRKRGYWDPYSTYRLQVPVVDTTMKKSTKNPVVSVPQITTHPVSRPSNTPPKKGKDSGTSKSSPVPAPLSRIGEIPPTTTPKTNSLLYRVMVSGLPADCAISFMGPTPFQLGSETEILRDGCGIVTVTDAGTYAPHEPGVSTIWLKRHFTVKNPTTASFVLSTLTWDTDITSLKMNLQDNTIPQGKNVKGRVGKSSVSAGNLSSGDGKLLSNSGADALDEKQEPYDNEHEATITKYLTLSLINLDTGKKTNDWLGKIVCAKLEPNSSGYILCAYATPPLVAIGSEEESVNEKSEVDVSGDGEKNTSTKICTIKRNMSNYRKGQWKMRITSDQHINNIESRNFNHTYIRNASYYHTENRRLFKYTITTPEAATASVQVVLHGVPEDVSFQVKVMKDSTPDNTHENSRNLNVTGKLCTPTEIENREVRQRCLIEHLSFAPSDKSAAPTYTIICTLEKKFTDKKEAEHKERVIQRFRAHVKAQDIKVREQVEALKAQIEETGTLPQSVPVYNVLHTPISLAPPPVNTKGLPLPVQTPSPTQCAIPILDDVSETEVAKNPVERDFGVSYSLIIHASSPNLQLKEDTETSDRWQATKASWCKKSAESPQTGSKVPTKVPLTSRTQHKGAVTGSEEIAVRAAKAKEARLRFLANPTGHFIPFTASGPQLLQKTAMRSNQDSSPEKISPNITTACFTSVKDHALCAQFTPPAPITSNIEDIPLLDAVLKAAETPSDPQCTPRDLQPSPKNKSREQSLAQPPSNNPQGRKSPVPAPPGGVMGYYDSSVPYHPFLDGGGVEGGYVLGLSGGPTGVYYSGRPNKRANKPLVADSSDKNNTNSDNNNSVTSNPMHISATSRQHGSGDSERNEDEFHTAGAAGIEAAAAYFPHSVLPFTPYHKAWVAGIMESAAECGDELRSKRKKMFDRLGDILSAGKESINPRPFGSPHLESDDDKKSKEVKRR